MAVVVQLLLDVHHVPPRVLQQPQLQPSAQVPQVAHTRQPLPRHYVYETRGQKEEKLDFETCMMPD